MSELGAPGRADDEHARNLDQAAELLRELREAENEDQAAIKELIDDLGIGVEGHE